MPAGIPARGLPSRAAAIGNFDAIPPRGAARGCSTWFSCQMKDIYVPGLSGERAARQIAAIAARQHGVFSRAQALEAGVHARTLSRRQSSRLWERLHPGVYRLAGAPATWRQSLLAACLAWGNGVVVSHRAAAALWGFPGFAEGRIELSVPLSRRRKLPHHVHRPTSLKAVDVTLYHGIPTTTPIKTLIDVAGFCAEHVVEEALDDALRRGLMTVARLRRRLRADGGRGRSGTALLRDLVDARAGVVRVPESKLETVLLRVLLAAGLPRPAVQHQVGRYRLDFAYPDARVAIEADGFRWHSTRQQWDRDRTRRNALTATGWTMLQVTWSELRDRPEEVVAAVRALIG